jgi:hypothetical protein
LKQKLKIHPITLLLFGVALFFYAFAWTGVAVALGVLGFIFESFAWISLWMTSNPGETTREED